MLAPVHSRLARRNRVTTQCSRRKGLSATPIPRVVRETEPGARLDLGTVREVQAAHRPSLFRSDASDDLGGANHHDQDTCLGALIRALEAASGLTRSYSVGR